MKLKRILAATLVATLVMASSFATFAATKGTEGTDGNPGSGSSSSSVVTELTSFEKAVLAGTVKANTKTSVAGSKVVSTVAGVIVSDQIQGGAVISDAATLSASLGLPAGTTAKLSVFDTDAKASYAAMNCVNSAAKALNADVVSTLNVDLFATKGTQKIALSDGSVFFMAGLPKNADLTKKYSVICVQVGGKVTVLPTYTFDNFPGTIAFEVKAGQGVYAIVAQ